jgi:hypothetical protein
MGQLLCSVIGSTTMTKVGVLHKADILKGLKVAIDGGEVDPGITLTDSICHLFRSRMTKFTDSLEDEFALRSKA